MREESGWVPSLLGRIWFWESCRAEDNVCMCSSCSWVKYSTNKMVEANSLTERWRNLRSFEVQHLQVWKMSNHQKLVLLTCHHQPDQLHNECCRAMVAHLGCSHRVLNPLPNLCKALYSVKNKPKQNKNKTQKTKTKPNQKPNQTKPKSPDQFSRLFRHFLLSAMPEKCQKIVFPLENPVFS